MKKIRLNILQVVILLISIIAFTGCSTDESEVEQVLIDNLNTPANRQLITELFTKGTEANKKLEEEVQNLQLLKSSNDDVDIDELLIEYESCSECPSEYKGFLIPFFQEIKDLNFENEIISKIEEYELNLEQLQADELTKDNLRFTLFSFKEATVYVIENSNVENRASLKQGDGCGREIGQGLVSGFVAGCIRGGAVGAAAGTVTVPVIGTVTGAVGGCIANGAVTGVISAAAAGIWCWINS